MRSILVATLLFFSILPLDASSAELKDPDAALALSDKVMKRAVSQGVREGLELLTPYIVVPENEFQTALDKIDLQLPVFASRFGKVIGYELIRNDTVGASLIQPVYLLKYEKHALVWRFTYYKNDKGWVLNTFKYADDFSGVL